MTDRHHLLDKVRVYGNLGVIVDISDAHGLTYGVVFPNTQGAAGRTASLGITWYDPKKVKELPVLTLIRGLPGSGKSTYAWSLIKRGQIHYEADMYHIGKDGVYRPDITKVSAAHAWCLEMATTGIEEGHDVIVSNTFTTLKELQPYLDMARDCGATVKVIHCTGTFESLHDVPQETMKKMAARWEPYEGEVLHMPKHTKRKGRVVCPKG